MRFALVLAAGSGSGMGKSVLEQYAKFCGEPMIRHALGTLMEAILCR